MTNYKFFEMAISEAKKAANLNEVPVGAVIVKNNEILSKAHNQIESRRDVTAHAELLALQKGFAITGDKYLNDCDMYVTLEPCPMCAQAISIAKIKRLYFGANDVKTGGVENNAKIFAQKSCMHKPEIYGGIMEEESAKLMTNFFRKLRENQ